MQVADSRALPNAKKWAYRIPKPYPEFAGAFALVLDELWTLVIRDITFISAQPVDALGPGVQKVKVEEAKRVSERIPGSL